MSRKFLISCRQPIFENEDHALIKVAMGHLPSKVEGKFNDLEVSVNVADWPSSHEELEKVAKQELKDLLEGVLADL